MPKKSGKTLGKYHENEFTFVSVSIQKSDRGEFQRWAIEQQDNLLDLLERAITDGIKISVSYDLLNDCITASATVVDANKADYNSCITSRSDNVGEALLLTAYKIFVLLEGVAWRTQGTDRNWG